MTEQKFKNIVWQHYAKHKRDLPWRKTTDPYHIWVSEIMLQQTQVVRVIPKYETFLKKFPTIQALAAASLKEVLVQWQGLGYNRRAKLLHKGAQHIVQEHGGIFPTQNLQNIPGVGPYTEGALTAFIYNKPAVCIETNIRTVYTHHFFPDAEKVSDAEILPRIKNTLDMENPREWYWALMDYGAHLKQSGIQINTKSKQYTKQSRFKGSDREVRGAIIRALTNREPVGTVFPDRKAQVEKQLTKLLQEGFIQKKGRGYTLAS